MSQGDDVKESYISIPIENNVKRRGIKIESKINALGDHNDKSNDNIQYIIDFDKNELVSSIKQSLEQKEQDINDYNENFLPYIDILFENRKHQYILVFLQVIHILALCYYSNKITSLMLLFLLFFEIILMTFLFWMYWVYFHRKYEFFSYCYIEVDNNKIDQTIKTELEGIKQRRKLYDPTNQQTTGSGRDHHRFDPENENRYRQV